MSKKLDKSRVGKENDRRIKLTPDDKDEILMLKGRFSQRELAAMYGVSKRSIHFIHNPDALERNKKLRQERGGWKQYYDKDKHAETSKEHRHYKRKLVDDGVIA